MDSGYEKVGLAMAPLGFEVTERPQVDIETRDAATGGWGRRSAAPLGAERRAARRRSRCGGHRRASAAARYVRALRSASRAVHRRVLRRTATTWKKLTVEGGPEGIVVSRKGGEQADWLCDLWLAERLADAAEHAQSAALDALDRGVGRGGEVRGRRARPRAAARRGGRWRGRGGRAAPPERESRTWPPPLAVLVDEVEVVAADLDPLGVVGEAEAEHRPGDVGQLEDVLLERRPRSAAGRAGSGAAPSGHGPARSGRRGGSRRRRRRPGSARRAGPAAPRGRAARRSATSIVGSKRVTTANGVRARGVDLARPPRRRRRGRSARRGRSSRRRARSACPGRGRRARPARRS